MKRKREVKYHSKREEEEDHQADFLSFKDIDESKFALEESASKRQKSGDAEKLISARCQ